MLLALPGMWQILHFAASTAAEKSSFGVPSTYFDLNCSKILPYNLSMSRFCLQCHAFWSLPSDSILIWNMQMHSKIINKQESTSNLQSGITHPESRVFHENLIPGMTYVRDHRARRRPAPNNSRAVPRVKFCIFQNQSIFAQWQSWVKFLLIEWCETKVTETIGHKHHQTIESQVQLSSPARNSVECCSAVAL